MNKNYLKIIIPIIAIVSVIIGFIVYLNIGTFKIIEISANSQVKISLNKFNKVTKLEGLNSESQRVVDNLSFQPKNVQETIKAVIETSNALYPLTQDNTVDVLFVSKNLQKDKTLARDLSTELSLISTELKLPCNINQYKLTKKDYTAINDIKKITGYRTFDILQQGFVSKESTPYITSIIYKSNCYFINFSHDIIFTGQEEILCTNGDSLYETNPAGYSKSTLALFINDVPNNTPLNFDISIKDYDNLFGYCISPGANYSNNDDIEITYSLDYDKNMQKLNDLRLKIIEADITEHDRYDLLNQYDKLVSTLDRINTSEQLSDFNTMCDDLENSITLAIEDNKENSTIIENFSNETTTPSSKPSNNNYNNSNTQVVTPPVENNITEDLEPSDNSTEVLDPSDNSTEVLDPSDSSTEDLATSDNSI